MRELRSALLHRGLCIALALLLLTGSSAFIFAQTQYEPPDQPYGPYNAVFLPDGDGLTKKLNEHDTLLKADAPWSLYAWVQPAEIGNELTLIAGIGDPNEEYSPYVALRGNRIALWAGDKNELTGSASLTANKWHFIAATFDGQQFKLYADENQVASGALALGSVSPTLQMAPPMTALEPNEKRRATWKHFGGKIASLSLAPGALTAEQIKQVAQHEPDFALASYEEGSKPWPVQTRGQAGYRAPQDPATMPTTKAPFSKPVARPNHSKSLEQIGDNEWSIGAWSLIEAPKLKADGTAISQQGFATKEWMQATVPGTVLTTMVDRGIYPDPDYGLNNLAIPESLNKQDYWYRTEFKAPHTSGQRLTLTFQGINYKASVWLNGQRLGDVVGAFRRGVFDVTNIAKPGETNVLAVRVSPPPHPGIPQEQSIKGGPGENGGIMCLDGPTFVATEGWDWIPAIRDRNTGIWQPVVLKASGGVKIGDPQVVTSLPLPDTSRADVEITVPVENTGSQPARATVSAAFEQVSISKDVTLAPGRNQVKFAPAEFAQLHVQNPRLWWPNGYGKPELYHLNIAVNTEGKASDTKQLRFGIREITYELSLLDASGHLRRLEYSPTTARMKNEHVVDVSHDGMRELPAFDPFPPTLPAEWKSGWKSWVSSIVPGAESSPSLRASNDTRATPYLVLKVNGVRIACRGGNWGMDDSRKRVSREKLEPYFRLHRDANLNFIRNWVGQDTEETFYELADEYGLLIWNDFWATTQNYNLEPQDPQLFLDNARDVIERFRNHPSIAVWCGRNEGVPQPIINEGLADLIAKFDGTRYYSPSSNQVNLQNSGPYKYMPPVLYYTTLNHGFSVETGTPSFSTLESFKAWVPKEDQWPISDNWAYHDWHQSGNGDVGTFMQELQSEFGAATSLEDFERKAQMLNYVNHRAIFEGMNAHLWAPNSARLLWMTQPAWPSNHWQILSSDYDTQASFYGVKKACERVHVQLDLSNYMVQIINNTTGDLRGMRVIAAAYSLDNKQVLKREERKDANANAETDAYKLDFSPQLMNDVVLLKLELRDGAGKLVSDNFYWLGAESESYRPMADMPAANLSATADSTRSGDNTVVHVRLQNKGNVAAIASKLTLLNAGDGARILPAYYSDNYVSLLPGETRDIEIEYPTSAAHGAAQVRLRGWNVAGASVPVAQK